jgi:hypothetical protein
MQPHGRSMNSTRTRVPGLSPPVSKVDATPGNEIPVRKIDVLSQVQRARAIGPAVHSTFPRPKSAVPAAFDLLELNGQDTAPLFRKQARECRRLATLAQDSEEAPFGFVCPSTG